MAQYAKKNGTVTVTGADGAITGNLPAVHLPPAPPPLSVIAAPTAPTEHHLVYSDMTTTSFPCTPDDGWDSIPAEIPGAAAAAAGIDPYRGLVRAAADVGGAITISTDMHADAVAQAENDHQRMRDGDINVHNRYGSGGKIQSAGAMYMGLIGERAASAYLREKGCATDTSTDRFDDDIALPENSPYLLEVKARSHGSGGHNGRDVNEKSWVLRFGNRIDARSVERYLADEQATGKTVLILLAAVRDSDGLDGTPTGHEHVSRIAHTAGIYGWLTLDDIRQHGRFSRSASSRRALENGKLQNDFLLPWEAIRSLDTLPNLHAESETGAA